MTRDKRMMTVILLRLARQLRRRRDKFHKQGVKVWELDRQIHETIKAIGEVHSIPYEDPVEYAIYLAGISYMSGDMGMRECLAAIDKYLAEYEQGRYFV